MGRFCCVRGCSNHSEKDKNLSFYIVPSVISHQGEQTKKLSQERRAQWFANINREDVRNGKVKYPYVCSRHFHQGKPSDLYIKSHPDWSPTKAMGHSSTVVLQASSESALKRHQRCKERSHKKRRCLNELYQKPEQSNIPEKGTSIDDKENAKPLDMADFGDRPAERTFNSIATHTDLTMFDIEQLENLKQRNSQSTPPKFPAKDWFEADEERVRFYTGLTTITVFMAVLSLISPGLPDRKVLTKFQQLLITIMRLRLNLPVQDLGYRFGVHASTVSRVFQTCIHTMFTSMSFLVRWPSRAELKLTMPSSFKKKFPSCVVILDCFEVSIDRPSCLLSRAQTWSSYKHHNTAKFLIGITPQGSVSFISKGWGGRTSDKYITEHCGLLGNLLPGDLVLADRGFDIHDSCGLYAARLQIPSFTKGKPQLSPLEIETTRSIANVRIHVERVIGSVRQKYTILGHSVLPIQYLMSDNGDPCLLDEIAFVCCALINCCKSVVATG